VSICDTLQTNGSDYLDEVQKEASRWQNYVRISWLIPTLCVLAFFGSWSDKISRKAPMLVVFSGSIIATACDLVCAMFMESSPAYLIIGNVVYGSTGGFSVFYVSIFSYLAEVVSVESRTTRISIIYAVLTLSFALSSACAGFAVEHLGFIFCYIFIIVCYTLSLIYAVIRIKDIKPADRQNMDNGSENVTLAARKDRDCKGKLVLLCNPSHFRNSFLVTFRKREGDARKSIIITAAICFTILATSGMKLD
jgi:PCFT/HCP family folate transporter-like MFS transporter 1/3